MDGELLHACLVTEDGPFATFAAGVDGEDGEATAMLLQHMNAKGIDTRRLTSTRYTADADADAIAAKGQTLVDDLLGFGLVVGVNTLYQCDGLREDGDIALDDALHHLCRCEFTTTEAVALQVGIDNRRLFNTTVDLQAGIFGTILWMFHIIWHLS